MFFLVIVFITAKIKQSRTVSKYVYDHFPRLIVLIYTDYGIGDFFASQIYKQIYKLTYKIYLLQIYHKYH